MLSTFYQEILFIRKSLSTAKFVVENEKHKMIEDKLSDKYPVDDKIFGLSETEVALWKTIFNFCQK